MRSRRGFTLIELMVALVIGLFVIAALYNLFTQQVRQLLVQDMQMEMHQNARLAVDVLSRTARMAGYGTGGTTTGVFGAGGDADEALPAVIAYNGLGPNGSDAVTFVSMDPALVVSTSHSQPPTCGTSSLEVNASVLNQAAKLAQFRSGELLLCYDYAAIGGFRSWMWQLAADGDAVNGTLTVVPNTSADFLTDCDGNLPLVMTCSRAMVTTFYVDADDGDGVGAGSADHPVLMMDMDFESPDGDDVPLVDNVEDLQLAYCLRSGTGSTDCSDPTAWTDSINTDQADEVYMVRIGVVVRASRDIQRAYSGQRPELEDNPAASSTDHYYRHVLSAETTVRNLRMQAQL